jgi:hypothetical protein
MRYEIPEVTELVPAIRAIQGSKAHAPDDGTPQHKDTPSAYEDWE